MAEPRRDIQFRILRREEPTSRTTLIGRLDEPLVVEQTWGDGRTERRRIVNPERSYQVPMFVFWDETVTPVQQQLIQEAIRELSYI